MIQWNAISDILELAKNPQFQDVILVCNNGKMKCNSIVLSLVSPQIQNALSSFPEFDLEKMITIMCLEIDIQDIKQFLNNILNQKEEISSCKALVDLLGHSQLGVKIEVDIELQDQFKVEEGFCEENTNKERVKKVEFSLIC